MSAISSNIDKKYRSLTFPDTLYSIQNTLNNIEVSVSPTVQPLDLYHRRSIFKPWFTNTVKDSIGVAFVNTHSKTKTYSPAETTIEEELSETLTFMKTLGIEDA